MQRKFVMGDIHGAYRALRQCLDRSGFDYAKDHLICLGDVADGWPETRQAVAELMRIQNLTYILGNHDWWTLQWMQTGQAEELWYKQGGKSTIESYGEGILPRHSAFFADAHLYCVDEEKLFVHAGINPLLPLEQQNKDTFLWDRGLASLALDHYRYSTRSPGSRLSTFKEIYIGHTPVPYPEPIHALGVWLMDTGAGWSGVLSMMDIATKEVFVSDPVPSLYPGVTGRQRRP